MTANDAAPFYPVQVLIEMIAARISLEDVGLLDMTVSPVRLIGATAPLEALWRESDAVLQGVDWTLWQDAPEATQVAGEALDPICSDAIVMPVRVEGRPIGLLVAVSRHDPVPGAETGRGLREGAELLGLLLCTRTRVTPETAVQYRIVPRAEAQRMIEARESDPSTGTPPALLLLDIDRFSAINAALGAPAGDALLAITATRLARSMGPLETLSRLEADRFLVLSNRPVEDLPELARKLLENVVEPIPIAGETIALQATLGLVVSTGSGVSVETLLMQAEAALRQGKSEGGNRIVRHEPQAEAANQDRFRLEVDLGQAIDLDQLRLVYQPYVDLQTGRASGVEALLRWEHPQRGELLPAAFIGIAERTGRILSIGYWTLRRALQQAADWPDGPCLSVNISALQFRQPDFTSKVDAALAETGFPAARLELEITETVLMRDNPETIGQLRTLINRGVRIALDDFGTGYSALAYLARLPHHRIKLDRCFVQDLGNPCTADLLRAIVASARAQGILVTAEGVETPEQLAEVRRMGFTHAQGFATGSPVSDPSVLWQVGQREPA